MLRLKRTRKTRQEKNEDKIQAMQDDIDKHRRHLKSLYNDRNKYIHESDRFPFDIQIEPLEKKITIKIKELEIIERQSMQEDFGEELFNYFKKFNFTKQREFYKEYLEVAEKQKVGSFLIHSEGNYKELKEQFWLWKGIFLSYLEEKTTTQIINPFFKGQLTLKSLFNGFTESLLNGTIDGMEGGFQEISEEEIELVASELALKLETNNIIIPIFLTTDMVNYSLIYDFLDKIWKPLHKILMERDNKTHWLKLFIIDNEVEDLDDRDYHVSDILTSSFSGIPFKLNRARFDFKDMEHWLSFDKNESKRDTKNVFHKYKTECKGVIAKFSCIQEYNLYLPDCKTIERLFDRICDDIPNKLITLKLETLVEKYAYRKN